jgi:hypothetical protein
LSTNNHSRGGIEVKRISRILMVVLGKDADEDDSLSYSAEEDETTKLSRDVVNDDSLSYSAEKVETRRFVRQKHKERQQPRDFTVERAAEIIDEVPSEVPQESAARIVRGALAAVGIEVSTLERVTRARETKLSSEIELMQNRQKELREKAEEAVRSLEEEIKKVRENYDTILAEEEKNLSRVSATLTEVRRVRAFFGFSKMEGEENTASSTQVAQPLSMPKTLEKGKHSGPPVVTGLKEPVRPRRLATASYKVLPNIEMDEFDEFVARIRRENDEGSV